jgi:cytosine/adenosine deaminase-related metal-dependent hydrolase
MRLNNLRFPNEDGLHDLWIHDDKIAAIRPSQPANTTTPRPDPANTHTSPPLTSSGEPTLNLDGALAFPGLINSHDHLDFNLFPLLGNKKYNSYTGWGPDIHANNKAIIHEILKIPQPLRTQWGIYKNLLNGFTTVVNHGEHLDTGASLETSSPRITGNPRISGNPLITIFQDCHCLHSVGFENNWKWKLNHPAKTRQPVAIHIGEGTDAAATREIDQLIRWNLFRRPLIGIHGVAMTEEQAPAFHALVWCPASNYFLLNRTAPVDKLKANVPILFGTDSTLTSGWNAWDQIRLARDLHLTTDTELLATLTVNPAAAWALNDRGTLDPGKRADLVIARPKPGQSAANAFFTLDPEDILLVIHGGAIKLFDHLLLEPITEKGLTAEDFQPTKPGGKYVAGDLPGLIQEIHRYCPEVALPIPS